MAKVEFGEWGAFTGKNNSVRYLKNGKMVAKDTIPPEVIAYLDKKIGKPQLTEEQKKELREESLRVKPELQASPEKIKEDAEALTAEDFDAPELDGAGLPPIAEPDESVRPIEQPKVDPDFLEAISIHTATLEDIARSLYERFGIYTVYLRQLPQGDEINPLTGENFSNHNLGMAYQAAIRAQSQGILDRRPEEGRLAIDQGRAASQNFQDNFVPAPRTMAEARRMDTFEFRTSVRGNQDAPATEIVHVTNPDGTVSAVQRPIEAGKTGEFNGAASRYDNEEDEIIVEPQMGKQVIRPNW